MAGQDFARVKAPKKKKQESSPASGSLTAVFGIVFAAMVCFAAGFWLGGAQQQGQPQTTDGKFAALQAQLDEKLAQLKLQQVKIEELEETIVAWKNKAEQKASDKLGELQFYKNLPKQSVEPAPISEAAAMPAAPKPAAPAQAQQKPVEPKVIDAHKADKPATAAQQAYRLQIVSYQSQADAVSFQRKLFNAGFSASVQPVDLKGRGKWFRVYAGPFADEATALEAQHDIQAKMKIRGLLVRDR